MLLRNKSSKTFYRVSYNVFDDLFRKSMKILSDKSTQERTAKHTICILTLRGGCSMIISANKDGQAGFAHTPSTARSGWILGFPHCENRLAATRVQPFFYWGKR